MTGKRCGTCTYWERGFWPRRGNCLRSESRSGLANYPDSPMFANDEDSYHAWLVTDKTGFWCSEHKEREQSA